MKRIVFAFLILTVFAVPCFATLTNSLSGDRQTAYWFTRNNKDNFMKWVDEVEGIVNPTAGTATASKALVLNSSGRIDTLSLTTSLRILESGGSAAKYTIFQGGDQAIDLTYTLPTAYPTSGYVLSSTDAGVLSWIATAAGVTNLDTAYNGGSSITADAGAVTITNTDADTAFVLALTPTPGSAAALGGMSIVVGANSTEDAIDITQSGSGKLIDAESFEVDSHGDVNAVGGTFSANLGVTGAVTVGTTLGVTGDFTETANATFNGNTDIGNATTDTLTIVASIDAAVYLDDASGASPSFVFVDGSDETATFSKIDNSYLTLNTLAADGLQVLTGNLKVGAGTPTNTPDGTDLYVTDGFEVDGTVLLDGAVTFNGALTMNADVTLNDQLAVNLNANDEEITVTGTATNVTAVNLMTMIMAAQDGNRYILSLQQTPDADAQNHFLVCEDNAGGTDLLKVDAGGETTWTLDPTADVIISAVAHTAVTGALDIDFDGNANGSEAVNIKAVYNTGGGASETLSAVVVDLDDDAGAADTLYGIRIGASDTDGSATIVGLDLANTLDDGIVATVGAAGQALVVDAATTANTGAAGVIDIDWGSNTASTEAVNIKATHLTGGTGQTISALEIELDADSGNASDTLNGIYINASDVTATGFIDAIHIGGGGTTAMRAALQADFGYVRIGTGSTPDVTPGDDDLFVEGTAEIDGATRIDGLLTTNLGITSIGAIVNLNTNSAFGVNICTGSSNGAIALGGNGGTVAVDSSDWNINTTGDMTNIGAITMNGLLTDSAGATITGAVINLNDESSFDVNLCTGTSTGTVTIGGNGGLVVIDSSDWNIDSTGIMTGIGAITSNGLITGSGGATLTGTISINDSPDPITLTTSIGGGTNTGAVNIGTGASVQSISIGNGGAAKTVALGSSNGTSTTTILSGSSAVNINASNNQPTNINSGSSSGTVTVGNALATITALGTTTINSGAGTCTTGIGIGATTGTVTIGGGSNAVAINPTTLAINTNDWDIDATGIMTGIGAITADGLFTGTLGTTITGAVINLNASSDFATNINSGTSSGTVTIGSSVAQTIAIGTGSAVKTVSLGSTTGASATTINAGSGNFAISASGGTAAITSSDWAISTTGVITKAASLGFDNSSTLQTVTVSLSASDVNALFSSPKQLVAATGDKNFIELVGATLVLDFGSAFTDVGNNLTIKYTNGSGAAASGAISGTGLLDAGADTMAKLLPVAIGATAAASLNNQPLVLSLATSDPTGPAGTSTMKVIVSYYVHPSGL